MRTLSMTRPRSAALRGVPAGVALLVVLAAACARRQDDSQPAAAPTATAYPGYAAPGAYAQPGQYPAAAPPAATYAQPYPPAPGPAAPAPAPAPAAPPAAPVPAPAGSGGMAVPGPLAFQCQNDVPCGTHHCNVQYGKCAFPCQSAADCIQPAQCVAGLCVLPLLPPH